MNSLHLEFLCKKFQERFSVQLQKTRQEEARFRLYTAGLQEFSKKILPALRLFAEKDGLGSNSYQHSQQAVTNLLIWLATPYLRSCRDFNSGVILFADLIAVCSDPTLKRRLVAYSNQLKTAWNQVEPGGLSHNPRAAKPKKFRENNESQLLMGFGLFLLLLLSGAVIYSGLRSPPREMVKTNKPLLPSSNSFPAAVASTTTQPRVPQLEPPPPVSPAQHEVSGIYRYADAQGGIHFVDRIDKVPVAFRAAARFTPDGSEAVSSFKVQIVGNQILVPVTLRNGRNSATALLLLDTGCSITTINEDLATRLKIDRRTTRYSNSRVADGRIVSTRLAQIDQMIVGNRSQSAAVVSILPHSGSAQRYDGLLGMSFLRQHRYQVDYDSGLIRWQ